MRHGWKFKYDLTSEKFLCQCVVNVHFFNGWRKRALGIVLTLLSMNEWLMIRNCGWKTRLIYRSIWYSSTCVSRYSELAVASQ